MTSTRAGSRRRAERGEQIDGRRGRSSAGPRARARAGARRRAPRWLRPSRAACARASRRALPASSAARSAGLHERRHLQQPRRRVAAHQRDERRVSRLAQEPAERVEERQIRFRGPESSRHWPRATVSGRGAARRGKRVDDRRLADAGLAGHEHGLPVAGHGECEAPAQDGRARAARPTTSRRDAPRGGHRRSRAAAHQPERSAGRGHTIDDSDFANEAVAAAVHRLDDLRLPRVVAQGLADLADRNFQDGVADEHTWPDGVEQIVLGDEATAALGEAAKQREGLGGERDFRPRARRIRPHGRARGGGLGFRPAQGRRRCCRRNRSFAVRVRASHGTRVVLEPSSWGGR